MNETEDSLGSGLLYDPGMRSDVEVRLGPGDRERLEAVLADRNSAQKHVWRARIILATAEGCGTMGSCAGPACPSPASGAGSGASWRRASTACCPTRRESPAGRRSRL